MNTHPHQRRHPLKRNNTQKRSPILPARRPLLRHRRGCLPSQRIKLAPPTALLLRRLHIHVWRLSLIPRRRPVARSRLELLIVRDHYLRQWILRRGHSFGSDGQSKTPRKRNKIRKDISGIVNCMKIDCSVLTPIHMQSGAVQRAVLKTESVGWKTAHVYLMSS